MQGVAILHSWEEQNISSRRDHVTSGGIKTVFLKKWQISFALKNITAILTLCMLLFFNTIILNFLGNKCNQWFIIKTKFFISSRDTKTFLFCSAINWSTSNQQSINHPLRLQQSTNRPRNRSIITYLTLFTSNSINNQLFYPTWHPWRRRPGHRTCTTWNIRIIKKNSSTKLSR